MVSVKAAFLLLSGGIAVRRWGLRVPGTSKDLSDALDCLCFGQECRREVSQQGEDVNKDLLNDFSRFVFSNSGDVGAGYFQNELPATSQ